MNKLTKLLSFFFLLLSLTCCDTVEDAYSVGDRPKENEILNLDQSQLAFKPDGGSYEIQINSIAKWEITIANNNAGQFSVSPSSGKGNATITVSCKPNSTQNSYNVELSVAPLNFNMDPVKVALRQANATFSIERIPSSEPVPEEGGSVTMTAYSSLNWELAVLPHDAEGNVGDLEWLSITPGLSGEGSDGNTPIEYRFTWTPNYSEMERNIRIQLKPSTAVELSDLPQPFTLTQLAGTLPQNVLCKADPIGVVDVDLTLDYTSRSPVKDCGLKVYKVEAGTETLFSTLRPEGNEYLKNGNYKFTLRDLEENSDFKIVPFVDNEVGTAVGESHEFSTGLKPENRVYQGVSIVNVDNGVVSVATDLNTATVSFVVTSDVEPLGSDRIASATLTVNGNLIAGTAEKIESGKWSYVFKVSDLQPNQEYQYSIEVKGKDLPRVQGTVVNNSVTFSGKFKTQGMTPDFEDNEKPNVGA